ncbi:MAG TPA: enoyl-CoA hydratase/isomerase family protein [Thermoanaerobaculia bacterium]|nr:enoyl-CoA hydratase/isomerase family protein [Thermoanaerobaculia bacterium]
MAEPSAAPTDQTLVRYEAREGVAYITLDAPPANTYTYQMMRQIDEAVLRARFDNDVHVIVLSGQGEKFFCAGADIQMLEKAEPRFKYYFCLHANETLNRLEQTPKLVIAALNGHTVGGGLEIAMAADLRIAKKDGGKVGLPEINLGVLPGTGGTQRLARLIGKSRSIELMITGRLVSFEDAREWGIVNEILDGGGDFMAAIHEYARQFCPPNRAAKAVGRIKRAVQSGAEVPFESGLAIERELQQQLFESSDAREGLTAYNAKRKPEFEGR